MNSTFQKLFQVKLNRTIEPQKYAKFNDNVYEVNFYDEETKKIVLVDVSGKKLTPTDQDKWYFIDIFLIEEKLNLKVDISLMTESFLSLILKGSVKNKSYVNVILKNKGNETQLFIGKHGTVVIKPAKLRYIAEVEVKQLMLFSAMSAAANCFKFGTGDVSKNPEFIKFAQDETSKMLEKHLQN